MQEAWVQSLGWEGSPKKEMATHSSILAREIPWTEDPGGLQSMGSQRVGQNLAIKPPPPPTSLKGAEKKEAQLSNSEHSAFTSTLRL